MNRIFLVCDDEVESGEEVDGGIALVCWCCVCSEEAAGGEEEEGCHGEGVEKREVLARRQEGVEEGESEKKLYLIASLKVTISSYRY